MHEGEMASNRSKLASLILDDGSVYKGKLFGSAKCVAGEVGKALLSVICFQKSSIELTCSIPFPLQYRNGWNKPVKSLFKSERLFYIRNFRGCKFWYARRMELWLFNYIIKSCFLRVQLFLSLNRIHSNETTFFYLLVKRFDKKLCHMKPTKGKWHEGNLWCTYVND